MDPSLIEPLPGSEPYTAAELARAAGVSPAAVVALIRSGAVQTVDGEFIGAAEAMRVGIALVSGGPVVPASEAGDALPLPMLMVPSESPRSAGLPAAVSTSLHVAFVAAMLWLTALGAGNPRVLTAAVELPRDVRLVFLNLPGPGGGGGGSGLKQPAPPPRAERQGESALSSPVPPRQPPAPVKPAPPPPPELKPKPLPQIVAPVAVVAADETDRDGLPEDEPVVEPSHGPGDGGLVGSGQGRGVGEGQGRGIGEGSGGGVGGGPYRPGSGIEPPGLLREVKPEYSEPARRAGIEGEVVLEIVVQADGRVGSVRVLEGLGHGLDERAVDAVRQWRFSPATRLGRPVDVLVEVAVEFRLR